MVPSTSVAVTWTPGTPGIVKTICLGHQSSDMAVLPFVPAPLRKSWTRATAPPKAAKSRDCFLPNVLEYARA